MYKCDVIFVYLERSATNNRNDPGPVSDENVRNIVSTSRPNRITPLRVTTYVNQATESQKFLFKFNEKKNYLTNLSGSLWLFHFLPMQ